MESGGSNSDFTVVESVLDKLEEEDSVDHPSPTTDVQLEINQAMIQTCCLVVGKTVVAITGIEELAFDEDETQQLVTLWGSLVPSLSPLTTALMGTGLIVAGKAGVYFSKRNEGSPEKALVEPRLEPFNVHKED